MEVPFWLVCGDEPVFALLKFAFFLFCSAFFVFFRGGSNMVAFCAKLDGTWQALSQCRLRYRVTVLRPNLPFSLFLPFPPFSFHSPFFPFFSFFHSYHTFPSTLLFFHLFSSFSKNPSPPLIFCGFQRFFGQSDASPCDPLARNVPREGPSHTQEAACCEGGFCLFLGIFRYIKKSPN